MSVDRIGEGKSAPKLNIASRQSTYGQNDYQRLLYDDDAYKQEIL